MVEIGGRLHNSLVAVESLRISAPLLRSSMENQNITGTPGSSGGRRPHVVVYPSIWIGHFIPFVELAKKMATCHGFSITFVTNNWDVTSRLQTAYLKALVSSSTAIRLWELPGVETEDIKSHYFAYVNKSMGALEDRLKLLIEPRDSWPPVCAFITDAFHVSALNVAKRLSLPSYIFFTSSAAFLSVMLYAPKLVSHEDFLDDADAVFHIPGIQQPISRRDLPYPLHNKSNPGFDGFLKVCSGLKEAAGILVNTFYELERYSIDAMLSGRVLEREETPAIYPIGPILSAQTEKDNQRIEDESRCLEWLDDHPDCSVIYVSFGSWGFMSAEQTTEMAVGLERSQQRFLWILRGIRPPAGIFPDTVDPDLDAILPQGFRCRVRDRGLVVSSWVPQISILSHRSIGGFVSHCGWNSTLEGIWCGVPIVAWPLHAEQQLNRLLVVDEWTAGFAVRKEEEGVVRKEEVERVTRELMEGEAGRMTRIKMKELSTIAKDAVAMEGSSFKSMEAATLNFSKFVKI